MLVAASMFLAGHSSLAAQSSPNRKGSDAELAQHAQAAQRAQRAGDFGTAVREFTALSRLLPDRADVHSNLGVAYFFNKQPKEALASFETALRLDPKLLAALIFSGIAQQHLSNPARATPLLERAVRLSPADALAHTWLGHSYAAQSRFREAADHLLTASKMSPRDVDIWYALGRVYVQLAQQEITRLTEVAPNGARVRQLAGDLWLLRGEAGNALALYQQALKIRPGLTEVEVAVRQLSDGQKRSATTESRVPDLEPASPRPVDPPTPEDAHYLAATNLREQAQRAFAQISAVDPKSHRSHQVLAESLESQERVTEALAEYRAALSVKPDVAGLHIAMGNLMMSEGRAAEALHEYREELRLRPEAPEIHYRIGRALIVLGKEADAETSLMRALASQDGPRGAQRDLGKILLNRGQHAEAVKVLSTYLQEVSTDASAHYLMMRACRALGDSERAARHLAEYKRLSDREMQQEALQKALDLFSPDKPPK